jgi:hypothetical protein
MVALSPNGQRLPQLPPRNWTKDEIDSLGTFRNLYLVT